MNDIVVSDDAIARPEKSKAESRNSRDTENLEAGSGGQPDSSAGPGAGGLDLLEMFIQMEERKQQLKLLSELLNNPAVLSLKNEAIPCSTTAGEIEQRKRELQYRIDVLKVLLEVTESELNMLSRAAMELVQPAE